MAQEVSAGKASSAAQRVLLPLALAQFICSFAGSNMNVMINDISKDLDTTVQGVQIAITIFLLVMAALMIPGGKLTDRYGRKRCFSSACSSTAIGALLSAVSPGLRSADPGQLDPRGSRHRPAHPAGLHPRDDALHRVTSRARAFGAISAMGGVGAAAGPLIGGLITSAISWRAAFVFQALVIVRDRRGSAAGSRTPCRRTRSRRFDVRGAVLSATGLVMLVSASCAADNNVWVMLGLVARRRPGAGLVLPPDARQGATGRGAAAVAGPVPQPDVQPRHDHPERPVAAAHGHRVHVAAYLQVVRGYNAIETGVIFTAATSGCWLVAGRRAAR